jgi:hypothetical protein
MHEECKIEEEFETQEQVEFETQEEVEELSPYLKEESYEEITSLEQELVQYIVTKGI